jgi:transposase
MSWREGSVMDERLQFVARRLSGEPMAELCREFGISRKTGYKIFDRYQECGVHGLTDRSRRPYRYAHQLPFQVENYILHVRREHPSWGARKIRERLTRRFSGIPLPAKSIIHAVLDRHGLVERRGRVRRRAQGPPLSRGQRPHGPWRIAKSPALNLALPNACFDSLGLPAMVVRSSLNPPNRRMRTRMSGGVAGCVKKGQVTLGKIESTGNRRNSLSCRKAAAFSGVARAG